MSTAMSAQIINVVMKFPYLLTVIAHPTANKKKPLLKTAAASNSIIVTIA